jgi:tetratricopeptide (TPR) repeat protein
MNMSKPMVWGGQWEMVLHFLDQAIALNPQYAELHYRRGDALLQLGRETAAKKEFILARDLDVCPLRARSVIGDTVGKVAANLQIPLVDYETLLEKQTQQIQNNTILGEEFFLDHVHPTIEGHKLLAVALLEALTTQGIAQPWPDWKNKTLPKVAARIEGGVNALKQGQALANLARVLLWAGKNDDAARLSKQALNIAGDSPQVADNAAASLATAYVRNGQPQIAIKQLYKYLEKLPNSIELRLKLGQILMDRQIRNPEKAAANILLVIQKMPYYDWGHALFGICMAERGRPKAAYYSLAEALRLNPNNSDARRRLNQIKPMLADQKLYAKPPTIKLTSYPSSAPRKLSQGRVNDSGKFIPDGIEVEFHENGRLKQFTDFELGKVLGPIKTWDKSGKPL